MTTFMNSHLATITKQWPYLIIKLLARVLPTCVNYDTLVLVLLSSHSHVVFPDSNMSGESEPVAVLDIDSERTYIDLDINRERRTYIDMKTATYTDIDSGLYNFLLSNTFGMQMT